MMRNNQPSLTTESAVAASLLALQHSRSAVARHEPEDAEITGMTRSLERRLLALNLPRGIGPQRVLPAIKAA